MLQRLLTVASLVMATTPSLVAAHGTRVEASVTRQVAVSYEVVVQADNHGGQPLAGAQVTVFAPDAPATAWLVGETDGDGRFVFAPDPARPGAWQARVYRHGHGGTVEFTVAASSDDGAGPPSTVHAEASSAPFLTTLQRVLMAACVIWGLVGMGLAFARRRD